MSPRKFLDGSATRIVTDEEIGTSIMCSGEALKRGSEVTCPESSFGKLVFCSISMQLLRLYDLVQGYGNAP
jgi:hypothetical protein